MSNDRKIGAVLGLAVGDALGTTYEFARIDQPAYPALAPGPASDVVGGGPFALAAGQVTDDTQMAVCLARSLAERGRVDVDDLGRRYVAWSAHAFDIGNQTAAALRRIEAGTPARDAGLAVWRASERKPAGNGSLMRTAPIALACADPIDAAIADSLITHADPRCALACAVFDAALAAAIAGGDLLAAVHAALPAAARRFAELVPGEAEPLAGAVDALERDLAAAASPEPGVYRVELDLQRTAGFVRVAFRLAFWHAAHTASWRDALVDVASRGGDADTNAAITGALLGARDGASAIPAAWRERVLSATQPGPAEWADAHHPRHLLALQ
ncbi:MAG: ADP-ribosylglycohydrolase family protein [Acidobacteriota bacterium]